MDSTLKDIYNKLENIFYNPASYFKDDIINNEIDDRLNTVKELIKQYQNQYKLTNTNINIDEFIALINNIVINSGIIVYFNKTDYNIQKFYNQLAHYMPDNMTCRFFQENDEIIDKYGTTSSNNTSNTNSSHDESFESDEDNIVFDENDNFERIDLVDFIDSIICKNCGADKNIHIICEKYIPRIDNTFSKEYCATCGMDRYQHKICDKFIKANENLVCECCGLDLFIHQSKMKTENKIPCANFESDNSNGEKYCKNCIYSNLQHQINPMLFKMNDKNYHKFIQLGFEFICEFKKRVEFITPEDEQLFIMMKKMHYK